MDGPCSGVKRQAIGFSKLSLTDFKIKISRSAREKQLRKAYEAANVGTKWAQTAWARRIMKKTRRQELTDFDRYKLKVLKQQVWMDMFVFSMRIFHNFSFCFAEEENNQWSSPEVEE